MGPNGVFAQRSGPATSRVVGSRFLAYFWVKWSAELKGSISDHAVSSRPTTPSPHASPSGEGRVGGLASPHQGGGWSPVGGRERETTTTSPIIDYTIKSPTRNLDLGELDSPTNSPASGAAEYTRRHTHPG